MGSLSRSDFGLFPGAITLGCLIVYLITRDKNNRRLLITSISGLMGACAGLLLLTLNNFIYSGKLIQASAMVKSYWMKVHLKL